jgi:hypothetical protein
MLPETREAWDVIRSSGFLKAGVDAEDGGLQQPEVIVRASLSGSIAGMTGISGPPTQAR